jgi:FlaA1/EpsC-like NDP-sugar epimerase
LGETKKKWNISHRKIRAILASIDGEFVALTGLLAYWMVTWGMKEAPVISCGLGCWLAVNVVVAYVLFKFFGLYDMVYASIGFPELVRIVAAVFVLFIGNFISAAFLRNTSVYIGYSVVFVYCMTLLCYVTGIRFCKRVYEAVVAQIAAWRKEKKRVMIVGCNNNGFILLRNMIFTEKSAYKAVCILDNDIRNVGKKLYDIRVVGSINEAKMFAKQYKIDEIFVATEMPSQNA